MFARKNVLWKGIILLVLAGTLVYLLYWRWQISQLRFFDIDEFTHLHWAAMVSRGELPYKDFFTYFSPGFMWVLAPLFWFFGVSSRIFITARIVEFIIFLMLLFALFLLFGYTRSWRWAILPVVILTFLPMPYDKFLEIRPDTISTLFGCIGILTEAVAIRKKGKRMRWWYMTGFFYSLSLVFLVKTAPFVIVGIGIAVLASCQEKTIRNLKATVLGFLIPLIVFLIWSVITGTTYGMWWSLVITPFEIFNNLKNNYMAANLFFYPNMYFYGGNGHTLNAGLLLNHAIWIGACLFGTYRLLSPFVHARGNRERVLVELLVGLTFFLTVVGYVKFFPSRYTQYLIPIAVFIAYYAADALAVLFDQLERVGGKTSLIIVLAGFAYLIVYVTRDVNAPKMEWNNTIQLQEVTALFKTVPLTARVVDLDGRMIFWSEGYSVCCLPFDDYLPYLTHPPLPLAVYLAIHPADYLYVGDDSGRFTRLLPENAAYVRSHFAPVPGWGDRLWKNIGK